MASQRDPVALEIEDPNDPSVPVAKTSLVVPEVAVMISGFVVLTVLFSIDMSVFCMANFSIRSIAVSSSSSSAESVWTVDFLVKKPSFRCSICYERDYVSAINLGPLKSAIVNVSHNQRSNGDADFSVVFTAETEVTRAANRNDVISGVHDLNIKLLVKRELILDGNQPGHCSVHCRNITIVFTQDLISGRMLGDNKIECHSSFLDLKGLYD